MFIHVYPQKKHLKIQKAISKQANPGLNPLLSPFFSGHGGLGLCWQAIRSFIMFHDVSWRLKIKVLKRCSKMFVDASPVSLNISKQKCTMFFKIIVSFCFSDSLPSPNLWSPTKWCSKMVWDERCQCWAAMLWALGCLIPLNSWCPLNPYLLYLAVRCCKHLWTNLFVECWWKSLMISSRPWWKQTITGRSDFSSRL